MPLFRRRQGPPELTGPAVFDFWQWWGSSRASLMETLHKPSGLSRRAGEELTARVHAIHPALAWEVGPGHLAEFQLTLSPEGDPALRAVTERWRRAGPGDDLQFEYHPARTAAVSMGGLKLRVGQSSLDLDHMVVGTRFDRSRARIDLQLHHPGLSELDDDGRMTVCFLALDAALGEDEVERWIGEVTPVLSRPIDQIGIVHLPVVVEQLTDEVGSDSWVLMEGSASDGTLVLVSAVFPLRRVDSPLLDLHVAVNVPYGERAESGLPTETSLQALRDFEDALSQRLGGSARLVAHLTNSGARMLHFYADREGTVPDQITAMLRAWPHGRALVTSEPDPAWRAVAPFVP